MRVGERMRQLTARTFMGAMYTWERLESGVAYTFVAPGFMEDPHPIYRALRERKPVHRSRLVRGWLFTRHADCQALLEQPNSGASDSMSLDGYETVVGQTHLLTSERGEVE